MRNDTLNLRWLAFFGRTSASSADSKSINFDDFFLTRPDLETPITSSSSHVQNTKQVA